jgi:molecular chaperone HscB
VASLSSSDRPNPFLLLGLEPRYDVDKSVLEKAFFERSKELHPDRFASASAAERVAALSKARALNDAYALLKQDATRAEYLLAQRGLTIGDNERIDPALVMELLEERETLAEARVAGDLGRVETLSKAMRARKLAALEAVKTGFGSGQWDEVKQQLILLRYVERYLEECDAALDDDEHTLGGSAEGRRG